VVGVLPSKCEDLSSNTAKQINIKIKIKIYLVKVFFW
jgi:hypothetical protein